MEAAQFLLVHISVKGFDLEIRVRPLSEILPIIMCKFPFFESILVKIGFGKRRANRVVQEFRLELVSEIDSAVKSAPWPEDDL